MVNQFDNRAGQKHVLNRFYVSVIIEWVGITTVSITVSTDCAAAGGARGGAGPGEV